ncbi:hypothetical protein MVES1_003682 [Malassezia vespertilionis]|uniref:Cleavage and polyadenylation specificity factor subunit 2 n=1 Tax=Malassezia vespertilionis TaxID=2020962 RepID=A0A2N1J8J7_9BASI|nr:uncharacterized protein MVES1_003682 [Malassezia vespertilionis]PKI82866.1 hypothetical protein MVES_003244 [Malassezia vespertilionis]WFD08310.1 hypothetical protein MVES1_003682 [Malassezia vespertilionis]
MLEFTPLSGPYVPREGKKSKDVLDEERPKALAYLIEIDGYRILLDCGAPEDYIFAPLPIDDETMDTDEQPVPFAGTLPKILERIAPSIDIVLLTHAEISHLGLYAYARAKLGLQCPAFATLPVQTMGRLATTEAVRAWSAEADLGKPMRLLPTENEVDEAFEALRTLRYLQPTPLDGKGAGLVLTAYNAGHSLGGTVWKLRSPSMGTVVLALDWNHNRERHLDGTALLPSLTTQDAAHSTAGSVGRADVLVTDIERGLLTNSRRKDRDAALLDRIHHTLVNGHSVLIPVDSAARLLELLVLLDQHWAYAYAHQRYPLCLVSHTGQEFVERARTFLEWMSREWAAQLLADDAGKGRRRQKQLASLKSPLDFPFLRYYSSVDAMKAALTHSQPKVVVATPASITHGPARALLSDFLPNPESLVLLLSRGEPGSVMRTLWERWNTQQEDGDAWRRGKVGAPASPGGQVTYELRRRVRLTGEELRAYLEREQQAKEHEAQQQRAPARPRPQLEADEEESSSSSDSSDEEQVVPIDAHRMRTIAPDRLGAQDSARQVSFDIYLRGHASRAPLDERAAYGAGAHYRMYPFVERKRKVDGYGEAINTARWINQRRRLHEEHEEQLDPAWRTETKQVKKPVAQPEPPSKYTVQQHTVPLRSHLMYVDMEGLNDGRALKTLIPQLQPRRLIMVNGDAATNADLLSMLLSVRGMSQDIYAPRPGATVRISGLAHAYSVKLGDAILSGARWSKVEEYNLVHIHAVPEFTADGEAPTLVRAVPETEAQHSASAALSTLYIGDLKLSALKALLARKHRIRADFAGEGVLVCDGAQGQRAKRDEQRSVTVTKGGHGKIVVEGNLSTSLGRVRQSVYDLYAQVHQ